MNTLQLFGHALILSKRDVTQYDLIVHEVVTVITLHLFRHMLILSRRDVNTV